MDELSETGVEYLTSCNFPLGDGPWSAQEPAGFHKVTRNDWHHQNQHSETAGETGAESQPESTEGRGGHDHNKAGCKCPQECLLRALVQSKRGAESNTSNT